MQYKNPVFTKDGRVNIELNHPRDGWIPFTASPDDPEPHGRELFESAKEHAAPYVAPEPGPEPVPLKVSRMQARIAIEQQGLTQQVEDAVAAADKITQIAWADATEFKRASATVAAIGDAVGLTSDQVDDLFRQAATIEA